MPIHTEREDLEALGEAKLLIDRLHEELAEIPWPPQAGSDLAEDEDNTPPTVHPGAMAHLMIRKAAECLVGAFHLCHPDNASGVSPVEVLLRTALIGSCRTAFLLSPDIAEERWENALILARVDAHSASQAWRVLGDFELTIQHASHARTRVQEIADGLPYGDRPGEAGLINRMIEAVLWRLPDQTDAPLLRERLLFMWHGYSGVAHANAWQTMLGHVAVPGALSTTGSLVDHLATLANAASFGVKILGQRSRS
ncbi:hypothetical protein [Arthrobacter sp. VKM Ac-2550]|uniref:hypothetical protein n=1 Tax=Crystallibacter permensis TaxID=1938888 RepID=UPI0022262052|nr:hypothetical protein [Arthrobacter sp. VKM Ac-2550]